MEKWLKNGWIWECGTKIGEEMRVGKQTAFFDMRFFLEKKNKKYIG
jgi:hypothetical protein